MKKVVILFIMFISLLCIDINIVSAANNSIVINHNKVGDEEIDNDYAGLFYINARLYLNEKYLGATNLHYGEKVNFCTTDICKPGNKIGIIFTTSRVDYVDSKMTNGATEVEPVFNNGMAFYEINFSNELDESFVIDYNSKPIVDKTKVKLTTEIIDGDAINSKHYFDLYIDENGVKKYQRQIILEDKEVLNRFFNLLEPGTKIYLVPTKSTDKKIVGYDKVYQYYDENNQLKTETKTFDGELELDNLDNAIEIVVEDSGTQNIVFKLETIKKTYIRIKHSKSNNQELDNMTKSFNVANIKYEVKDEDDQIIKKFTTSDTNLSYEDVFDICKWEEYCAPKNTITIRLSSIKPNFVNSNMKFNGKNIDYKKLDDGSIEYSFTLGDDIDTGEIEYVTEPVIDDSLVKVKINNVGTNSVNSNHSFIVYVDTGITMLPIATIPYNSNNFYLNEYIKEIKADTTYYLVPINSFRAEIVGYEVTHFENNELITDEKVDKKLKLNNIDDAIKITLKDNNDYNVLVNVKEPVTNVNLNIKQINDWDLPNNHFGNLYGLTTYVYVYDNLSDKYVYYSYYTLDGSLNIKLPAGQKYLVSTRGSDRFDISYFEYKNDDKKITKKVKDYSYEEYERVDNKEENIVSNGIKFDLNDEDNPTIDLYGNAYASVSYVLKYVDQDPNGITHANKSHYLSFNRGSYYKLLEEKDGKRVYIANGDNCSEEKEGTNDCIHYKTLKVDTNGYTTIYFPFGWSHEFMHKGTEDKYQKGYIDATNESDSPYTVGYRTTRVYYAQYVNPYAIKNIKKTDQEGRPVDASFNITVASGGADINQYSKLYKYVYNHYDEREINGKIYKNVYEVKDIIPADEENKESVINTKKGEFTLYYPIGFTHITEDNVKDRRSYNWTNQYTYYQYVNEIDAANGHIINTEPTILKSYWKHSLSAMSKYQTPNNGLHKMDIKNMDDFDLDEYIKEHWNDDKYLEHYKEEIPFEEILINNTYEDNENEAMFDTKQNRTIVNKKVPTIKKTVEGNGPKDKEYTFLVYEKESNELVETIKVKANEEGYLDITKLVNGKTYIIREKIDSEDYTNTKIEVLNGEAKEDKDGKYYEFTYDEELAKLYEANFYNKYKEITVPDTGDNVLIYIIISIISTLSIVLVTTRLRKGNN